MGNMTIRGITHPETVENVNISKDANQVKITGEMVIDRKKIRCELGFSNGGQGIIQ